MSDSRYKAKVFMDWPLELHNLIRIIFNLEVNSFLLLYYTVSEIDFVLLLDRQVLEQNIFIIGFTLNFEPKGFKLVEQSVGSDLPLFYARIFGFELDVKDSISLGRQCQRITINEFKVIVVSQLKLCSRRKSSLIFQRNRLNTSFSDSGFREFY